jgi:hypothetical protein
MAYYFWKKNPKKNVLGEFKKMKIGDRDIIKN